VFVGHNYGDAVEQLGSVCSFLCVVCLHMLSVDFDENVLQNFRYVLPVVMQLVLLFYFT